MWRGFSYLRIIDFEGRNCIDVVFGRNHIGKDFISLRFVIMRVFYLRARLRVNLFVISQKGRGWSCGRSERSGIDDGIRLGGNIDRLRRGMTVDNEVDSDGQ